MITASADTDREEAQDISAQEVTLLMNPYLTRAQRVHLISNTFRALPAAAQNAIDTAVHAQAVDTLAAAAAAAAAAASDRQSLHESAYMQVHFQELVVRNELDIERLESGRLKAHKRAVLRLEGDISRLYAGSLKTHERAAAAETERDFLKRRNEGLQAFVEKLQMADAAERAALLQCPEAEMRRLSALPQLRPARERA